MIEIEINSKKKNDFIDITDSVQEIIAETSKGEVMVFVPHTTAAVSILRGSDPSVHIDIIKKLTDLIPYYQSYENTDGTSDAHIKSMLVGKDIRVIIEGGRLCLGKWQRIFFCEFNGPQRRKVFVKTHKG